MAEYIEREALIQKMAELREDLFTDWGYRDHYTDGFDLAQEEVELFPAADVMEVKRGRWVEDGDFLICLNCESEINVKNSLGVENRKNFCPNCGADMREEADNE